VNINLNEQEMEMLLRMVNIGDWIMSAEMDDEMANPNVVAHKKVLQKLFTAAHEAKMDDIVCYDPSLDMSFETAAFEDDYLAYVHEYTAKQLLEELPNQLAIRDLVEQVGEEVFENMDILERAGKLQQLAFMYEDEFDQHGLERLHLLNVSKHAHRAIG